jgi:predicted O-methyltransferase YrrM
MNQYQFTVSFTPKTTRGNITSILNRFGFPNSIIEIGCYEGDTTFWMAENIGKINPNLKIYAVDPHGDSVDILESLEEAHLRFTHNLEVCPIKCVEYIRKTSNKGLIDLINRGVKAEVIFIDGDHTASSVMTDLVLAWELLEPGGVIICDDATEWQFKNHTNGETSAQMSPRMAVEMFIQCNWHKIKPLWLPDGLQTAFVKK